MRCASCNAPCALVVKRSSCIPVQYIECGLPPFKGRTDFVKNPPESGFGEHTSRETLSHAQRSTGGRALHRGGCRGASPARSKRALLWLCAPAILAHT